VRATGTFPAARKSEVDWSLFELGADLCLEGWRWNRFEFGGCVSTDAGPLIAGGRNVEDASTAWLFLARSGLRLRARFDLTDEWSLSLDGGPDLVWSRPRARLDGPSLRNVLEAQFLGLSTGLFVERSF
jgi:hypothetical protein